MQNNTIYYGIGRGYLPAWGITEALREIYQNFMDYGDWQDRVISEEGGHVNVVIENGWQPHGLDFLRIGHSKKDKEGAVGKHGEGIKMAFMILLRNGLTATIHTQTHEVWPEFYIDPQIGECFCLKYHEHEYFDDPFKLEFTCLSDDYYQFKESLISDDDIIFPHYYGDIVNKDAGNIYSGGLFVASLDNLSRSYNLKPEYLTLDRDRKTPRTFDVNWHSCIINEAYGKWTTKDMSYSDTMYISRVPEALKQEFEPTIVGEAIEFVYKENGEQKIVKSDNIKNSLKSDSFFEAAIRKLKNFLAKKLGIYDLLIQFKEKHHLSADAALDLELIIEKVKQGK